MKNILDYYKFQINEMLLNTMSTTQAEHHITTDIFTLNNNEILDDDFLLYFEGRFMIIELTNNYKLNAWMILFINTTEEEAIKIAKHIKSEYVGISKINGAAIFKIINMPYWNYYKFISSAAHSTIYD